MSFIDIIEGAEQTAAAIENLVIVTAETIVEDIFSPDILNVVFAGAGIFGGTVGLLNCIAGAVPAAAAGSATTVGGSIVSLLETFTELANLSAVFLQVNGPYLDTALADALNAFNLNFYRFAVQYICLALAFV